MTVRNAESATPDQIWTFMHLALPDTVAQQLHGLAAQKPSMLMPWLEGALQAGHFDVYTHTSVRRGYGLTTVVPCVWALRQLLVMPGTINGNGPDGGADQDKVYGRGTHHSHLWGSFRPDMPDGMDNFLDRLADRIELTVSTATPASLVSTASQELLDNLRVVMALAISLDHVALVKKLDRHFQPFRDESELRLVPHDMLGFDTDRHVGDRLLLHPGTMAMHFGADKTLSYFLSTGWQPGQHGALVDERDWKGVPSLLAFQQLRLQPSSIGWLLEHMTRHGLTKEDRQEFGELSWSLPSILSSSYEWSDIVLSTGLAHIRPVRTLHTAAAHFQVKVLDAVYEQAHADADAWNDLMLAFGHPALIAAESRPHEQFNLLPDAKTQGLLWFLEHAQQQGPQALEHLFTARVPSQKTFGEHLVAEELLPVLYRALELGLDPSRRPGPDRPSLIELAQQWHCPNALDLMLAHVARSNAIDALAAENTCAPSAP